MTQLNPTTLAQRLGKTAHVSPLRMKLISIAARYPVNEAASLEDWLIELANRRGARIVFRDGKSDPDALLPDARVISNEELVTALCQLQCQDRPQILRLAAQLISRGGLNECELQRLALRERTGCVLAELARLALRIEPNHPVWNRLREAFRQEHPLREPLLHWTRLAHPIMQPGKCNAQGWKLVT